MSPVQGFFSVTENRLDVLQRSLPFGFSNQMWLLGSDITEERKQRRCYQALRKNDLISSKTYTINGEKINRDVLTQKGSDLLCLNLSDSDPYKKMLGQSIYTRTGLNNTDLGKMICRADTQYFLSSVGVDSIYTAVVDKKINPFLCGYPSVGGEDSKTNTIEKTLIDLIVKEVQEKEQSQSPYLPCLKSNNLVLYLPNNCNPLSGVQDSQHNQIRSFNNSVGLLIDFTNRHVYTVFKSLDRKNLNWRTEAYKKLIRRTFRVFHGFENVSQMGYIQDAIILCETKGEMFAKASQFREITSPFNHVYPILMKREGMDYLSMFLNCGTTSFRKQEIDNILSQYRAINKHPHPSDRIKLQYQGRDVYVGTDMDLCYFHRLNDAVENNNCPFIICYDWQKEFYETIANVPSSLIAVI